MIRIRACERGCRLDSIKPEHLLCAAADAAPIGESPAQRDLLGPGIEEARVEAQDHIGIADPGEDIEGPVKREPRRLRRAAVQWLIGVPCHRGKLRLQRLDLPQQGWRRDTPSQEGEPRSLVLAMTIRHGLPCREEILPGADFVGLNGRLSARRIVEIEDFRLGENVGGTEACGVPRVAFYLRGAALVRGHDDAAAISRKRKRRRKCERDAGHQAPGHCDVRYDLFFGLRASRRDQRHVGG